MKSGKTNKIGEYGFLLPVALILLALTLMLGTAYARYCAVSESALEIANAAEMEQAYLLSADGNFLEDDAWSHEGEGTYFLHFLLSNAAVPDYYVQKDLDIALRVASTVSDQEGTVAVHLSVGGDEYVGEARPITKGSILWRQYGDGHLYYFYNEAGEELYWTLKGGHFSQTEMCLTVSGAAGGTVFTLMTVQAAKQGGRQ